MWSAQLKAASSYHIVKEASTEMKTYRGVWKTQNAGTTRTPGTRFVVFVRNAREDHIVGRSTSRFLHLYYVLALPLALA